jgi:hypothetical protein
LGAWSSVCNGCVELPRELLEGRRRPSSPSSVFMREDVHVNSGVCYDTCLQAFGFVWRVWGAAAASRL